MALFLIIENNLIENKSEVLAYFDTVIENTNLKEEDDDSAPGKRIDQSATVELADTQKMRFLEDVQ